MAVVPSGRIVISVACARNPVGVVVVSVEGVVVDVE